MTLHWELKGLDGTVCDCGVELTLEVQHSAAGYYLGYLCCCCGPYSRETGYFITRAKAETALHNWLANGVTPDNLRSKTC